jgi:RNA polymerase sigma-70 factor, ECF subfamily
MHTRDAERRERFREFYATLYGRVYSYAARRVGDAVADDVSAETFLIAWRRFDDIPSPPLPWLYGVASNVVARHRVADGRQNAAAAALLHERSLAAPFSLLENAGDSGLWDAWALLSDADREVLALIAWEELAVRDAARVIGCSAAVFSVRLHRARRRFEWALTAATRESVPTLNTATKEAS